ncbi:hypothetical protein LOAG_05891 [Loa loa]|uniref:Uncharacterized protein n=1 Tax=Loa loa TaxID=7209 RepID=A0A1S0TZ25_LOALO|nr:hypothetical protein LOAG_05891 [Loa loa]EFO22594.1 hypothetical protein LOAG_05891 [Loa loa]
MVPLDITALIQPYRNDGERRKNTHMNTKTAAHTHLHVQKEGATEAKTERTLNMSLETKADIRINHPKPMCFFLRGVNALALDVCIEHLLHSLLTEYLLL